MRILVVMLYWYPYEGPLMPIYGAIIDDLIDKGHEVTIVSSFPHYRKGREETWEEYRGKLFEVTSWHGARLIRCYVFAPVFKKEWLGLIIRALNFISFNISCIFASIFLAGKQDIIFAPSSPPLTNGISAYIISKFKRIPFIYNVQDMYPDMAIKLGILRKKVIFKLLRFIEDFVYKKSAKVFVISNSMKNNLMQKRVKNNKIEIIPNFIDYNFIKPMLKENPFSIRFRLNDKFIVMYAGSIGLPHGLEFVVESAEILKDEKEILFCFVSRGEYKDKIIRLCNSKKLKNTVFIPQQPEEVVPEILASSDVSLVTSRKGLSGDSVPSKTFGIMASGRPVLAMLDEGSEVWKMVTEAKGGICVPPESPELLAEAILRLHKNAEERLEMGENARRYVVDNFHREVISQKYEEMFLSVAKDF